MTLADACCHVSKPVTIPRLAQVRIFAQHAECAESAAHSRQGELQSAWGFLRGLGPFLKQPLDRSTACRQLDQHMAAREVTWISVLERAVFQNPSSPYRTLLDWAGITLRDISAMVADLGLEGTLASLYDKGIYITLEEFKGRHPLRRPGLRLDVNPEDFDHPLSATSYEARTGGSTGAPRRLRVDLGIVEHETAYHGMFLHAAQISERPVAIWHAAPPGAVGIKTALIHAKLGRPVEKWFSQSDPSRSGKQSLFTKAAGTLARLHGTRIPAPEYTTAADGTCVSQWLASKREQGTPAILVTTPSACVRACMAAQAKGYDIAGTFFILVGEPYTQAKAAIVKGAGCSGASHYAMAESGMIGLACQAADFPDDVHLVSDKIATIQRALPVNGRTLGALFHTTILPVSPKLMLNVESGDYGVLEERECNCGALPRPYRKHLHTIRSYAKLTSEGMCFLDGDLVSLVERILPTRFGGYPTDYQFVEQEMDGLPKVALLVRPTVGAIDEDEVVRSVIEYWRNTGLRQSMMSEVWANGRTLQVVRADPHATPGGKIPALRTLMT